MTGANAGSAGGGQRAAGRALVATLAAVMLAAAGCGQKGDLYLPGDRQTLAGSPATSATG